MSGLVADGSRLASLRQRWARFSRVCNGVLGADRYERYLQWHRSTGQHGEPMDRRAFWRHEYERQEKNPGSRCC